MGPRAGTQQIAGMEPDIGETSGGSTRDSRVKDIDQNHVAKTLRERGHGDVEQRTRPQNDDLTARRRPRHTFDKIPGPGEMWGPGPTLPSMPCEQRDLLMHIPGFSSMGGRALEKMGQRLDDHGPARFVRSCAPVLSVPGTGS